MRRFTFFAILIALISTGSSAYAQSASKSPFTDIRGHWAENTIVEMVSRGILDGYPDGTFRPDAPVKVDQFIKMLILSYTDLHQNGERS